MSSRRSCADPGFAAVTPEAPEILALFRCTERIVRPPPYTLPHARGGGSHDGGVGEDLAVPLVQPPADRKGRGLREGAARGAAGADARPVAGVRARGDLARVPRFLETVPVREPAAAQGSAARFRARAARSADRHGGAPVSALLLLGIAAVLAWSVARESARRRRWREAERLSRW